MIPLQTQEYSIIDRCEWTWAKVTPTWGTPWIMHLDHAVSVPAEMNKLLFLTGLCLCSFLGIHLGSMFTSYLFFTHSVGPFSLLGARLSKQVNWKLTLTHTVDLMIEQNNKREHCVSLREEQKFEGEFLTDGFATRCAAWQCCRLSHSSGRRKAASMIYVTFFWPENWGVVRLHYDLPTNQGNT